MSQPTRRQFLQRTAATGGMLTAGALFPAQSAPAADQPLAMTIARWKGEPTPEDNVDPMAARLTEEAIRALGGMARFVSKGDVVCVKPNIGWDRTPEQAANTNPAVVATLIRLCFDAGAKTVRVGDHSCNEEQQTYANSGIAAAAREAGAEVFFVDKSRFRQADIGGDLIKSIGLYPEIVESDLVINVPIAKHHRSTQVTLCMKNYLGVVDDRGKFHQDLPTAITDITRHMKPRLCVLDAVRILTANGPTGGNLTDVKRTDTILAGTDIVALDAFGAQLLGNDPQAVPTVVAGHKAGLGQIDYNAIPHQELAVS